MTRAGGFNVHAVNGWNGPTRTHRPVFHYQPGPADGNVSDAQSMDRAEWNAIENDARISTEAPRVPWDVFLSQTLVWEYGEHFALIGPTGQGKSTMLLNLLPLHRYMTIFVTKPRDATFDALAQHGYLKMERWQSVPARNYPRRLLWPDATKPKSEMLQRAVFDHAFSAIYREGGWTVALDELWYFSQVLKMEDWVERYLSQARSLGISLLIGTQRPADIPLMVYDQSTHLMFWRDNDETNLKRLSGIGYRSANLIRGIVSNLERYQVLYVNTRTGRMFRTRCPDVRLPGGR
jgi:energy-coupling factor transporter ATP-binding protein EcfA2